MFFSEIKNLHRSYHFQVMRELSREQKKCEREYRRYSNKTKIQFNGGFS